MATKTTFAFDASPLVYFARTEQMDVLKEICDGIECVVTEVVVEELRTGLQQYPSVAHALRADWIFRVRLEPLEGLGLFAEYAQLLGSSRGGNLGEAATLAWAELHGATAIVDDGAAVNAGRNRGVNVHGTLWLVVRGMNLGILSRSAAESVVAAHLAASARYPFASADEFIAWARSEGLLE